VGTVEAGERTVPRSCRREVEGFLKCGVLSHGFSLHAGAWVGPRNREGLEKYAGKLRVRRWRSRG
jgi:hypothetical protein